MTEPKVYFAIDAWHILGPAPIMHNAVHPTIPHRTQPISLAQHKLEYPDAKEDSKPGAEDGSPHWIVNIISVGHDVGIKTANTRCGAWLYVSVRVTGDVMQRSN